MDAVADKHRCNICMKVLRDARLTECCGQHYCHLCLAQWLEKQGGGKTCPQCGNKDVKTMINKEKIREINEIRIRCTHHKKGCDWVGELEDINSHLQRCDCEEVTCTNTGYSTTTMCGEAIERRYLTDHQKNACKYRQYTCEYCGYVDTYDAIAGTGRIFFGGGRGNHHDKCNNFPLECPNECGDKTIKRRDMTTHRNTCPLEPLDCPFKSVGCNENKLLRMDLSTHTKTSTEAHLLMVVQSFQELARKYDKMVHKNEELAQKNEKLVHKNKELTEKMEEFCARKARKEAF